MKLIFLLLLALTSCSVKQSPNCGFHTYLGQRISWKKEVPVKIYIDKSFPQENLQMLLRAMGTWEYVVGRHLFVVQEGVVDTVQHKDGKNVVYMGSLSNPSELGVALIWSRGDQIKEADIIFTPEGMSEGVMIHELGHLLGLDHSPDSNSIMYYSDEGQENLTEQDKLNVRCEY